MRKKKLSLTKIIDAELNAVKEKNKTEDKWTIIEKKKEALFNLYENHNIMKNISVDELLKKHKQLIAEDHSLKEYMIGITSGVIAGLLSAFATQDSELPWFVVAIVVLLSVPLFVGVTFWVFKAFCHIFDSDETVYINKYHAEQILKAIQKKYEAKDSDTVAKK